MHTTPHAAASLITRWSDHLHSRPLTLNEVEQVIAWSFGAEQFATASGDTEAGKALSGFTHRLNRVADAIATGADPAHAVEAIAREGEQ